MAEQSIKPKRRKWIILTIIMLVILLTRMYLNSPYTYVEERKIINYALKGSRDDFKLNSVYLDNENKVVTYEVYNKYKADIEKIGLIRLRMKEYLVENPDYFINDDYYIKLVWRDDISGHPWVLSFNNIYGTDFKENGLPNIIIKEFDSLDCLLFTDRYYPFKLSDITDYKWCEDIKGLVLCKKGRVGDIEILKSFKSLEFFEPNDTVSDEDLERFREMHPECEVY